MTTETTGTRIRARRVDLGWSQSRLAGECNWSGDDGKVRISRYERDARTPSYDDAQNLGAALGISPHTLLTGEDAGITVRQLHTDCIWPDDTQPRRVQEDDPDQAHAIEQLAASIGAHGMLQPITVRPSPVDNAAYIIIYGHRRYLAAEKAGLHTIPAIIRTDIEDTDDRLAVQILENLQRLDLTLPELVTGVAQLARTRSHDQIAAELGRSRAWVSRRAALHDCRVEVWQLIADGQLRDVDAAHALVQLYDIDAGMAEVWADGLREGRPVQRADLQSAVKRAREYAEQRQAAATTDREAAEKQRQAEEQANNTSSGYDGPIEDADTGPAEVTGREGAHQTERKATATAPDAAAAEQASEELQQTARCLERQLMDHLGDIAGAASARFDGIDCSWHITLSLNKRAEAESLVEHIRSWRPPAAGDLLAEDPPQTNPLYDQAVAFVRKERQCSISQMQRHLRIAYNEAARLVDAMENAGIVGARRPDGSRQILAATG